MDLFFLSPPLRVSGLPWEGGKTLHFRAVSNPMNAIALVSDSGQCQSEDERIVSEKNRKICVGACFASKRTSKHIARLSWDH